MSEVLLGQRRVGEKFSPETGMPPRSSLAESGDRPEIEEGHGFVTRPTYSASMDS